MSLVSKSEKKVLTFWVILVLVLLITVLVINIKFDGASILERATKRVETEYSLVKDRDRYFTVKTAIEDFYGYLNSGNTISASKILNEDYKLKNKISNNNINRKLNYTNPVNVISEDYMCQRKIDKGIYSYYVHVVLEDRNDSSNKTDSYYEVILNNNTVKYDLKLIDKDTFGGACRG